jgi:hypothetical protein
LSPRCTGGITGGPRSTRTPRDPERDNHGVASIPTAGDGRSSARESRQRGTSPCQCPTVGPTKAACDRSGAPSPTVRRASAVSRAQCLATRSGSRDALLAQSPDRQSALSRSECRRIRPARRSGLNRYTASDKHRAACKALALEDYRLKDQRHSYAVRAARAGTPAELIGRQLGHANAILVLKVYGRFMPSQQERDRWEQVAAAQDADQEKNRRKWVRFWVRSNSRGRQQIG